MADKKIMTGAEIFVQMLKKENTEAIFGIPGGVLLPVMDALYNSDLRFILTRHEQGATHMADGYARATGKTGVVLVTSGPGATNTVTGIATAYMDSVPVVVFTGQVTSNLIGNDAFQEADITGITRPITKHNYLVKDVTELARVIKEAFYIASTGRQGPVLVDFPKDVATAKTEFQYPENVSIRGYKPNYEGHPGQIKKAAKIISDSCRPIIYAGGGVISSDASEDLVEFANKIKAPVTTTLLGLGCFPQDHPLSLGMIGMHGVGWANHAIMSADLIIGVGARFDDRVTGKVETFAPGAKIIHIDIDPSSVGKSIRVDIPIVGDAKGILKELILQTDKTKDTSRWLEEIKKWKIQHPLRYKEGLKIKPEYVIEQICKIAGQNAIICTEVGQNQMWVAQFYKFKKPRTLISSGGLGTMGYGFPAAIGAKVGCPDKTVFDIAGDGSFQMNIQELATCLSYNIPVKVAILNNGCLGMVRQWQELFYNKHYYASIFNKNPDFAKVAEAYGAVGMRITKKEDVPSAIEKALKIDNTVVMDFVIDETENVFPMVPSGTAITEMIELA